MTMIAEWLIPSYFGDVTLTSTGVGSCSLVAERVSVAERDALAILDARGRKKGWIMAAAPPLTSPCHADLAAPLEKVAKLLARAMKPGRKLVTAVKFRDGRLEELVESRTDGDITLALPPAPPPEPIKAVTVAAPRRDCPPPDFESVHFKANRVLEAFLTPEQLTDWRRYNRFIAVGGTTGHRYMICSRHARDELASYQRTLFDLDERRALHVQDHEVPAPEECLAFAVLVQLPGRESCLRSVH